MPGLLDFIGTPEGQGLLSAAFGGLAGARQGTPFNNSGRAGVSGLVGYNQARDQDGELDQRKQRQQLFEMQLAQMQQAQADRAAERTLAQQSVRTPQQMAMAANGGPTNAAAAAIPTTAPGFDRKAYIDGLYQINPREAMALEQALIKDDAPMIIPEGATLVSGRRSNFQPLAKGAPKADSQPTSVREFEYAKAQGYTGTYDQFKTLGPTIQAAAMAGLRGAQIADINYGLPTPPASPAGGVPVTAPDGKVYVFPNQQAADQFKARIK